MEPCERTRLFAELAESIKSDQTIPKKWARKLLSVNRGLMRQVKTYDEALETLRGSKQLLEKVSKGKITMEQYDKRMSHARQQVEEFELFAQLLSKVLEENEKRRSKKRASATRKDQQEALSREDSYKSPSQRQLYHG